MDSRSIDKSTDEIIVVSGDEDIIKCAENLRQKGLKVTIYAWGHSIAWKLKDDGLDFIDLTPHFDEISR